MANEVARLGLSAREVLLQSVDEAAERHAERGIASASGAALSARISTSTFEQLTGITAACVEQRFGRRQAGYLSRRIRTPRSRLLQPRTQRAPRIWISAAANSDHQFREHAANDVFVDLDTERMSDLPGDAHTAAMPRSDFHKARFFRRCATVFKISRESSSSDTARAMPMAPTSAVLEFANRSVEHLPGTCFPSDRLIPFTQSPQNWLG